MRRRLLLPALVAVALVTAAVVGQLLRQRGSPPWDVVQSDDGYGFLAPAWSEHPISLLWTSYAGYLQLLPRLIATPLAFLPRSWGAAYLTVTSAIATALLAWFVAAAARGLVRQPWLRWLLAFAVVFLPGAGWETTGVLSELQFALTFAAFWAVISTERSRMMVAARVAVVVLAATSAPLALLFLPLALAVAWWRRDHSDKLVAVGLAIGSLLQAITMLVASGPPPIGARTVRGIPSIYLQRVIASWVVGDTQVDEAWLELGDALLVLSATIAIAIVVVLAAAVERRQWWWGGAAFVWSGATLAAALWSRGITEQLPVQEGTFTYAGARYVLVPMWLFLAGIVLLAGGPPRAVTVWVARTAAVARGAVAVQLVVLAAVGFRIDSLRSPGPSFAAELRTARAECHRHPDRAPVIRFAPPTFYARVPCDDL